MTAFVVYKQPDSHTPRYVLRKWNLSQSAAPGITEDKNSGSPWTSDSLDALRMFIPEGFRIQPREASDNPLILETWLR